MLIPSGIPPGNFSGIPEGTAAPSSNNGDLATRSTVPPVLGIGMGKGMAIGMIGGKGGKGSISNMGFSHPSHRLALLSGHVHMTMMPGKVSEKIRSVREEEMALVASAADVRETLEREAEAVRQCQLQTLDREQQVVLAAAQSAAIAARLIRQKPLHTAPNHQQTGQIAVYNMGGSTAVTDRSPRGPVYSPGNLILNSSPAMSHLNLPPGSSRMTNSLLPQTTTSTQLGNIHPNHSGNQPEKDACIKPITAASVLTTTMQRVNDFTRYYCFDFSNYIRDSWICCTTIILQVVQKSYFISCHYIGIHTK